MTDERDNLMEIFDTIINNDGWWDEVHFKRNKGKLEISAKGHDMKYHYSEVDQYE